MYGNNKSKCKFCGVDDESQYYKSDFNHIFHICKNCGLYLLNVCLDIDAMFLERDKFEESKILSQYASYFYYHKKTRENWNKENIGYYVGKPEICSEFKEFYKLQNKNLISITDKEVLSFYPSTLSKKENLLLHDIFEKSNEITNKATYTVEEMNSAAFVIRHPSGTNFTEQYMRLLEDLKNEEYIKICDDGKTTNSIVIEITTKGIKKVQEGEKSMANTNSGSITNFGNMVLNSNVSGSIVGNSNSTTDFDYEGLSTVISQIEKIYKSEETFSSEVITQITSDIEEIKTAIQQHNQPVIQRCLNDIKGFVTNVSAGIIASGIWTKISPYIQQIPGLF